MVENDTLAVLNTKVDSIKEDIGELKASITRLEDRRNGYLRIDQCKATQEACEKRVHEGIALCAKNADVDPLKKIVWGLVLTALAVIVKEIMAGRSSG